MGLSGSEKLGFFKLKKLVCERMLTIALRIKRITFLQHSKNKRDVMRNTEEKIYKTEYAKELF